MQDGGRLSCPLALAGKSERRCAATSVRDGAAQPIGDIANAADRRLPAGQAFHRSEPPGNSDMGAGKVVEFDRVGMPADTFKESQRATAAISAADTVSPARCRLLSRASSIHCSDANAAVFTAVQSYNPALMKDERSLPRPRLRVVDRLEHALPDQPGQDRVETGQRPIRTAEMVATRAILAGAAAVAALSGQSVAWTA